MGTLFYRGQQLGPEDLNVFLENKSGHPTNAAEITYAIYDFTTGAEALVGSSKRTPANPAIGHYYASLIIPNDANIGAYRVRWTIRELIGGPVATAVQEFTIIDRMGGMLPVDYTEIETDLIRRLRVLLRDNNPDRNYHFRPPTHTETVNQYNRVFGFIWEDSDLKDFIEAGLNDIIAAPPRTPFASVDQMVQYRAEWRSMLLTSAMYYALQALQLNWIADEFDYSIGGVSLNLDKASKYESAKSGAQEQFEKQLERAKATVKFTKGLQQPKYGSGIRSSFGPFVGKGVTSPRKFVGF